MPTNLYGPNDNFLTDRFARPASVDRRYDELPLGCERHQLGYRHTRDRSSSTPTTWPMRACICSTVQQSGQVNVGTGTDLTIREIAQTIAHVVGYAGRTE